MKIDFVAWGSRITGLGVKPEDEKALISAEAFRYSEPFSYKGTQLMEIHQVVTIEEKVQKVSAEDLLHESKPLMPEKPAKDETAGDSPLAKKLIELRKEKPTLVGLVSLPVCQRCTVLLAPIGKGLYHGYVIEDDPTKLPLGQVRMINLSQHRIALRCNGKVGKELDTRDSFIVPAKEGGIIYELAYKNDSAWVIQENNMIAVKPDEQVQMIVLQSNNQFFLSSDGSRTGFLQNVILKRQP